MGKKDRNKVSSVSKSTQSFAQHVKEATSEVNRAFIAEEISKQLQQVYPALQRMALDGHKNLLVRTMVLEDLILELMPNLTASELQTLIIDKQDSLMGYETVFRPAEQGDTVRFQLTHKKADEDEFSEAQTSMIQRLNRVVNVAQGTTQLFPEVEEALIGKSVGDEVVVTVEVDDPEFDESGKKIADRKTKYDIKATVDKVMLGSEEKIFRQTEAAKAKAQEEAALEVDSEESKNEDA